MRIVKLLLLSVLVFTSVSCREQPEETIPTDMTDQQKDMTSSVMIRLIDPLDEPEFYCVDVPGYGQKVQLDSPLTAHTLKAFGSADEMWVLNYPAVGQIYIPAYERCIEAENAKAGASLYLKQPGESPLQRFTLTESGSIVLAEHTDLGFAVAPSEGEPTGGPSHLKRNLNLANLAETPEKLTKWKLVKDAESWPQ